jgi:mannose-1-phosphate guanylyltransferase
MNHIVIMSGGSGTRFWPASRRDRPKQLLSLVDERPILRATFERVRPLVPPERIWVVTTSNTARATRELLPELPANRILIEPQGRDTAACAGYAAHVLVQEDEEAVCAVLPADHIIGAEDRFRSALAAGFETVARDGGLLTFGIRPTHPETGYGYLEIGAERSNTNGWPVHLLDRFVEKPDEETARSYITAGNYLWNSGIFVWRTADFLAELKTQLPELATGLELVAAAHGTAHAETVLGEVYPGLPRTSVDYGVMEGADRCWTIPVDFPWSDVGAWPALAELLARDRQGNTGRGRTVAVASKRNILVSDGPVVAVAGVEDLVVVATHDAVLVVPAKEAQRVKDIVAELERRGWDDVL